MPTRKVVSKNSRKELSPTAFIWNNIAWLGIFGLLIALLAIVGWNYTAYKPVVKSTFSHTILATKPGKFGSVSVVRDIKYEKPILVLIYGKSVIGGYWEVPEKPSLFIAFEIMSLALHALPDPQRALVIGLGIGIFAKRATQMGVICDIVEIDPVVVNLASQYFEFATRGKIYEEDVQKFIGREEIKDSRNYDIIVHDIFSGDISSRHYTLNILQQFESILTKDGIFVLNYVGKPESLASKMLYSTLSQIWQHVKCFVDVPVDHNTPSKLVNMVFFSSHNPITIKTTSKKTASTNLITKYKQFEFDFPTTIAKGEAVADTNHEILKWGEEEKREYVRSMLELFSEAAWKNILSGDAS